MRKIGTLDSEELAERFCDFLRTQLIPSQHDPNDGESIIWVNRDDDIEKAKTLLEEFKKSPDDAKFKEAAYLAKELRKKEKEAEEFARKNTIEMGRRWQQPANGPTPLTFFLIAVSIATTLFLNFGNVQDKVSDYILISKVDIVFPQSASKADQMSLRFQKGLPEIRKEGQVWRLVTPIILHLSPLHLIFNMYWTYHLGRFIELKKGTIKLLVLVVSAAVVPNYIQYLWSGPAFAGMSGVGYGLFGYIWIRGRLAPESGFILDQSTIYLMLGWMVICFMGFMPVANAAHVFGLLVGMAAGAYRPLLLTR